MAEILTSKECYAVVKNYLGKDSFEIVDYKIKEFNKEVNGFLGEHLSLQIQIKCDEEVSKLKFFAKRFPFKHSLHSEFCVSVGAFQREMSIFEDILPEFRKTIPNYDTSFVPKFCFGKHDYIVIFEDLSIKGYTLAKKPSLNLLDLDHLKLVLKCVAKFHSGSLAYEEIKSVELGRTYRIVEEHENKLTEPLFIDDEEHLGNKYLQTCIRGMFTLIDLIPENGLSKKEFKERVKKLFEEKFDIMKPQSKFRNVLSHNDLWPKNFLYKYENDVPIDCKLVDFQLTKYFPPAYDILYLLFLTTNREMRQHHFHSLIRFYHNCLKEELGKIGLDVKTILSFDEFKCSIHYYLPYIKLFTASQMTTLSGNPEFVKTLISNEEEFKKFVFEDRSDFNRELFDKDENFQYLLTEALMEIREVVSIPKVSREDCYKVMNRKLGTSYYTFDSFKLIPCTESTGFMGDYFKLKIFVHFKLKKREYNFFVKCMSSNKSSFDLVEENGLFSKEIFIYETFSQMANNLDVEFLKDSITCSYYTRINDLEILEDMALLRYKIIKKQEPFSVNLLELALKKVAKFHAASLVIEEKMSDQLETTFRFNKHYNKFVGETFFLLGRTNLATTHWKVGIDSAETVIDLFPEIEERLSIEEFKKRVNKLQEEFYEIVKPSKIYRNVICHGDIWATNLLFKCNEDEIVDCKLIDFQNIRYCVPGHDVLSIIYFNADRKTRKNHMGELIDVYYRELKDCIDSSGYNIEEIYPYEQFLEMLNYIKPQILLHNLMMREFTSCTEEEIKIILKDEEACEKIFYKDRSDLINKMVKTSKYYKEVLKETVVDLYEYCTE